MSDKYVMAAGTALLIYALSIRKRKYEILENLAELSSVMQAQRAELDSPLPESSDPSPIIIDTTLNTPTPQVQLNDAITEINIDYNANVGIILMVVPLAMLISFLTAIYCASYGCCDVLGPEL
jgi:hypothetical protein